jgi:hypothetical protein
MPDSPITFSEHLAGFTEAGTTGRAADIGE